MPKNHCLFSLSGGWWQDEKQPRSEAAHRGRISRTPSNLKRSAEHKRVPQSVKRRSHGLQKRSKTQRKTQTLHGSQHKLPLVPWDDWHGRGCLAFPVLVLLVLHLWLGPMPVLWASTSNSLISYMSQPTGWSGHSSLPAILHTVQPRLIFNTEAKHVKGLKCENVHVCVWRGGVHDAKQLTFFKRIHRSSHFCLLDARLDFFFWKETERERERGRKGL